MKIEEELEALERERELIQCDLNNARSKGRGSVPLVWVGGDGEGMGVWSVCNSKVPVAQTQLEVAFVQCLSCRPCATV